MRHAFRLPPTIRQLLSPYYNAPSTIEVTGWIKSVRRQKRVSFAVVSDGSSSPGIQAVFNDPRMTKWCAFSSFPRQPVQVIQMNKSDEWNLCSVERQVGEKYWLWPREGAAG